MNPDKYLEYLRFLPPNAALEACRFCARSQHSTLQNFDAWGTIDVCSLYVDVTNLEIDIVPSVCPQLACANCVQNLTDFQGFLHKMREVNAFWKQYYSIVSGEPASINTEQPNVVNADESIVLDDDDDIAIVEEQEELLEEPVYVTIRADGSCMGVVQAPGNNDQQMLDAGGENDNSRDIIELEDSDDNEEYTEEDTQSSLNNCSESSSFRADHICSFCSQQFMYQCDLYRHQHIFHLKQPTADDPNRCNVCNMIVDSWQTHQTTARRPTYKCTMCPKIYRTKQGLKLHLQAHHLDCAAPPATVKFQCNLCKKIMLDQISMEKHVSLHSKRPRPYQCGQCLATFQLRPQLKNHFRVKHSCYVPQQCVPCGDLFLSVEELEEHTLNICPKKSPYGKFACTQCSMVFSTTQDLEQHSALEHRSILL